MEQKEGETNKGKLTTDALFSKGEHEKFIGDLLFTSGNALFNKSDALFDEEGMLLKSS